MSKYAHITFLFVTLGLLVSTQGIPALKQTKSILFLVVGFFSIGVMMHYVESLFLKKKKEQMWDQFEKFGPQALHALGPSIALTSNLLTLLVALLLNLAFVLIFGS